MKSCQLKLKKLTEYQVHHLTARGKKNFECVVCGSRHGTQNAMYLHMLWKHPETKFVRCKLCSTYIDAAIGLPAHFDECHSGEISTSLKSKVLKCKFCEKIFEGQARKYLRSKHTATFHSDVAVRCASFNCCRYKLWFYISYSLLKSQINFCRYFQTQAAMEKHANESHDDVLTREKVSCIFCGVAYLGKRMLKMHVTQKHRREVHFCPKNRCGRHFKTTAETQKHVKEDHESGVNEEMITCIFCGKRISSIRY